MREAAHTTKLAATIISATTLLTLPTLGHAAIVTWDGSHSSDWTDGRNWDTGTMPANNLNDDIATFNDPTSIPNQPRINASRNSKGWNFTGAGWHIAWNGSSTHAIGDAGINFDAGATGGEITIDARIYLGSSQTWHTAENHTIDMNEKISGNGRNLDKSGAGTLILNGESNSYSQTNVNEGTLLINGSLDDRTADVTVAANAMLGGNGTINRNVMISSNGTITGGDKNNVDTLAITHDLAINGLYFADLSDNNNADKLDVSETLDITNATLILNDAGITDSGTFTIASYGTLLGTEFANIINQTSYTIDTIDYSGGQINVSMLIPEPSSILSLMGALLVLPLRRKRTC
ncbi:autotransporter-associated beta strand repeat-containing protein [Poriferisphaera sp. WC338]|uniref:autotransporter-associated beta strand repeat-containing protein n=1 Tax=Poriferisphaera sp. WC338 TaxID=3425129 RepID=UPI003D816E8E